MNSPMPVPTPIRPLSAVKLALMAKRMREQAAPLLQADPIAIVGIGCRVPGGGDTPERFWRLLREGVNAVSGIPADRWDGDAWFDADGAAPGKSVTRRAGFLDRIDGFDAAYFGIPRREAERMDPQQRLFLEVAIEAIDDAGLPHGALRGSRTGVYIASYHNDYTHLQYSDPEQIDLRTLTGTLHSVLANRLSYHLDLRGPSLSIDTACSSSLVAVHLACQSLRAGETDIALAGGVSLIVAPELMVSMSKVGFMAPDGQCKTFDASADGFGRGEGCGVIVLKRLSDAVVNEDRVLAVIRGSAVNQDGHSTILTAPHGPAQEHLIRDALASAMLEPDRIGFVETHGTGTALGDPIEVEAIAAALGRVDAAPCFLGSAKANVGHLEAAAGITGLIKAVQALRHAAIPPQVNFATLNPHIALAGTRLRIPTSLEPWPAGAQPRCAAVSSFGVGGTNAHVIVEEAPRPAAVVGAAADGAVHILPLSAQTQEALRDLSSAWVELLADTHQTPADLCFTAAQRRTHYRCRTAVVGRDAGELRSRLTDDLQRRMHDVATPEPGAEAPKIGFVFSGQGPQWFAMGRQLLAEEPVFRDSMVACDALLKPLSGWSLLDRLAAPEDRSQLDQTIVAQPALFSIQVSLAALLRSWGATPDMIAGHSVGEIAALHAAGVLDLAEAMRIVWHRGRIMQDAAGGGRMAALAVSEAEAAALIAPYGERLAVAAVNAPRSIVLSGEAEALREALASAAARGVSHRMLDVPYAFHSAQMMPMQERLVAALGNVSSTPSAVAFYSTVTGKAAGEMRFDAAYFGRNVRQTVRFADAIDAMAADGCDLFVELSPHPVLGASITECVAARGAVRPVVATLRRGKPEREALLQTCVGLYAAGCDLDWAAVQHGRQRVATLPSYPWQRQRYWIRKRPAQSLTAAAALHPLFATYVVAATGDLHLLEGDSVSARPWLADHRIFGRLPLPATAMLDGFAFVAGRVLGRDAPVQLRRFVIHRPLMVPEDEQTPARWQVTATPRGDTIELAWHEAVVALDGSVSWRLVAGAEAAGAAERGSTLETSPVDYRHTAADLYARFDDLGVAFGPSFRALDAIAATRDAANANVDLPDALDARGHLLHPVLLDALLQLCSVAAAGGSGQPLSSDVHLPVAAERVVVAGGEHRHLLARARIRAMTADAIVADASLETPDGTCVALIEGMRFARADADVFATASPHQDLYDIVWQRAGDPPHDAHEPAGDWLLFADDGGTADALAATIAAAGGRASLVRRGAAFASGAGNDWTIDPSDPAHARRLLADIGWQGGQIVHCWNLDAATFAGEASQSVARDDAAGLGSLLHLVQALARHDARGDTRLAILTRGAQRVADEPAHLLRPRAAGAWGLATVIAREHRELKSRLVDLDPSHEVATGHLLSEVHADAPPRIALRDGGRWIPGLRRVVETEAANSARAPMQLSVVRPGTFDGVDWHEARRASLPPDAVRLSVVAAGLNFRDVLIPLGLYPEPMALGAECAGVVVEVGSAVTGLGVGDRVFGFAPGSMATEVVVPAAFLAPIPERISFDDAAGIAVAFLTAWHGLHDLARLQSGERVLIHAAAGGVGLAAVQLAQRCGAEIFATAGSPEKRDMLRGLGVAHVYDSRSLDFADAILAETGGRGVDVVLNSLADDFIGASLRTLATGGRFLELGKRGIRSAEEMRSERPDVLYYPYDLGGKALADRALLRPLLDGIVAGLRADALRPLPVTVYPVEQAREAMRFMAQALHTGKIVLRIALDTLPGDDATRVRTSATYWITGGLGALGLATAEWLARRGARHIVLTGRQPPRRSAADRIAALEAQGIAVRIACADVADRAAMAAIRDDIRAHMPPLAGVVHAAGVLRDAVLLNQRWDDGQAVLRGKAHGAWLLHDLTRDLPLDFFILYSAAGVVLGAPGQGLYSAANAQLDALAEARRAVGLPALSVAWGAWADAGMAAEQTLHGADVWQARGLRKIVPATGFAGLEVLLARGVAYGAVLPIDWSRFMASLPESADRDIFSAVARGAQPPGSRPAAKQTNGQHDGFLARVRALPDSQRRDEVLGQVSEQVRLLLGADADAVFDPRRPLKELGVDSLMAVELRNVLVRAFGKPLSATLGFDHPTLDALTAHLMAVWELTPPESDLPPVDADDIERLSPEAAEALLLRELELGDAGRSG
ncbi:MAG TPA: type I polyketide synthase [Pseudolabrys sp.]|nr:type I polyketide synthase [Pseudolabrys sp.]